MKILLVEDESQLREVIKKWLEKERYIIEAAHDLNSAQEKIAMYSYDCVLLDIMLPDGNGLTLLQQLKQAGKSENVIILSAKDAIEDKIEGLNLGADDYLPKPFHLAELSARIKSVIRRTKRAGRESITCGNVIIYPSEYKVEVAQLAVELGRKEYDILCFFTSRPNRLVSKEVLAESVWGDHIDQADNYDFIYAQIKNLRKKLQEAKASIEIKSVYGFGYKLILL